MNKLKNIYIIVSIIFITLLLIFLLKKPKDPEVITVEVPVRIEIPIPAKEGKSDTIYLPSPIRENPINKDLEKRLKEAKDSLSLIKIVKEELKERDYKQKFDDLVQTITVSTKVQGRLLNQSLEYFVKADTITVDTIVPVNIEVPTKIKVFGLLEAGNSIDISKIDPVVKGSVIFKNKTDKLLSVGFDSNKNVWIGYGFKF